MSEVQRQLNITIGHLNPGGGGLPYISHVVCAALKGTAFRRLGLKTGIAGAIFLLLGTAFAQFGLELSMVFEGTTGVYGRIHRFNSKWVRKKEKYASSKWILINLFFVAVLIEVMMT